jgi:hypothetical protein
MVPICRSEKSVGNDHYSLHNDPEGRGYHLHRGGRLKSRIVSEYIINCNSGCKVTKIAVEEIRHRPVVENCCGLSLKDEMNASQGSLNSNRLCM